MRRNICLICCYILFGLACVLPALEFRRNEDGTEIWAGGIALFNGILGLLMGHVAWLANPLLALGAFSLFHRHRTGAVICAVLALLFSLDTFQLFYETVPGDEAGVNKLYLRQLREGTFCWMGSMVAILIGGIVCEAKPKPAADTTQSNSSNEIVDSAWE